MLKNPFVYSIIILIKFVGLYLCFLFVCLFYFLGVIFMVENVLFTKEQIDSKINSMAMKLDNYIQNLPKEEQEDILLLGLLNGCIHFVSDLTRKMKYDHKLCFLKATSYIDNKQGKLTISGEIPNFSNMHVIILDDICDTGKTLKTLVEKVNEEKPRSVKTCVLLDKKIDNKEFYVDYKAFEVEDLFVYGYGMDFNGYKRNLNDIRVLEEK